MGIFHNYEVKINNICKPPASISVSLNHHIKPRVFPTSFPTSKVFFYPPECQNKWRPRKSSNITHSLKHRRGNCAAVGSKKKHSLQQTKLIKERSKNNISFWLVVSTNPFMGSSSTRIAVTIKNIFETTTDFNLWRSKHHFHCLPVDRHQSVLITKESVRILSLHAAYS